MSLHSPNEGRTGAESWFIPGHTPVAFPLSMLTVKFSHLPEALSFPILVHHPCCPPGQLRSNLLCLSYCKIFQILCWKQASDVKYPCPQEMLSSNISGEGVEGCDLDVLQSGEHRPSLAGAWCPGRPGIW